MPKLASIACRKQAYTIGSKKKTKEKKIQRRVFEDIHLLLLSKLLILQRVQKAYIEIFKRRYCGHELGIR